MEKVAPSHADGNIEKKEKQKVEKTGKDFEDSEMKRRLQDGDNILTFSLNTLAVSCVERRGLL